VEPLEFLDRLKSVALKFNKLTDTQKMILKHWIRNTVDETIAENAVKILEVNKEGVEKMVANNAFMIKEMKEKVEKEGIEKGLEKGLEKERENSRLKDIGRVKNLLTKKFGVLYKEYNPKIESLDSDKLNLIIENILDIENLDEVEKYF